MTDKTLFYVLAMLGAVLIGAISQVLLKKATQKTYKSWIWEYLNPWVLIAYLLFLGTTVLSVIAYRGIPLSLGPVLESTSYLFVAVFGVCFFGEKLSRRKISALGMIICGILIYSLCG